MPTLDQPSSPVDVNTAPGSQSAEGLNETQSDLWRTLVFSALDVALLLWVALYNGYPTVFPDTGGYLWTGARHVALAPYRAPGYAIFTNWSSLGHSGWFTAFAQSILVVYVLYETCSYLIGGERKYLDRCLLASVSVLAALSSLPWLVSLLMPDVFAGVAFLSAFLLATAGALRLLQRILLASIFAISVAAHASLFPIAALYVAALVAVRLATRRTHVLPTARAMLAWLLVPILVAGIWTANLNDEMGRRFTLSSSKNSFLLGRLFGDGLAADFLRENCPRRQFVTCKYLSNLPRSESAFLFQHPLIRELRFHEDEVDTIVRETIRAYPGRFLLNSARQTVLQLVTLRTGEEIRTPGATNTWNYGVIQQVYPGDLAGFTNGRQFLDGLLPLANAAAGVHTAIFWLCVAACLFFAFIRRFERMNRFLVSAVLFLVINAAVCGALAGVYDRYQSRVAWIMPFCLTVYICCWIGERKRGAGRRDATAA